MKSLERMLDEDRLTLDLLRNYQWCGHGTYGENECPVCGSCPVMAATPAHADDCAWQEAMRALEERIE